MQLQKLGLIGSLALLVTACAGTNKPASVQGGECRVFERPPYVVFGQTGYDQNWIDGNVEAGVAACKWQRPDTRPESLRQPTVAAKIIKRKSLRKRIKERIWPAKVAPVVPVPPIPERIEPVRIEPAPPPTVIIRPVDPVDDLLDVPSSPIQPAPPPKKKRWFNR